MTEQTPVDTALPQQSPPAIQAAVEVLDAWDTYMGRSQAAEWESEEDWARIKAGMKVLRHLIGNPPRFEAARLAVEVQAVNDWVRTTLESLCVAGGLPVAYSDGRPRRDWELVDMIEARLRAE